MATLLASDESNPQFLGAHNPDAALYVRFYEKPVQNAFETIKQGRPIMEMRTMIHIEKPGDILSVIDTFAYDHDKKRFPQQWAHFQNSKGKDDSAVAGTMLTDWSILTPAQAEELRHFKFYTVEQVAFASDQQIGAIGMTAGMNPLSFRERAKQFLATSKDSAIVSEQAEKLAKAEAALAEQNKVISEMNAKIAALMEIAQQPAKRGRRPNAEKEAA